MRSIIRQGKSFTWTDEAQKSFEAIKKYLSTNPVLSMFDPELPVFVSTDASDYGLGAVLQQMDGPHVRTIAYASRTVSETERRYSMGEKIALACLWACEKWHIYLWGWHFTLLAFGTTIFDAFLRCIPRIVRIGQYFVPGQSNIGFQVSYSRHCSDCPRDASGHCKDQESSSRRLLAATYGSTG